MGYNDNYFHFGRREQAQPQQVIDARAPLSPRDANYGKGPLTNGLTDPLVWANQFRRADSQLTSLPTNIPAGQTAATYRPPVTAPPRAVAQTPVLDSVLPSNPFTGSISLSLQPKPLNFGAPPAPAPSITSLASAPTNHADAWSQYADLDKNRLSFGSAFQ